MGPCVQSKGRFREFSKVRQHVGLNRRTKGIVRVGINSIYARSTRGRVAVGGESKLTREQQIHRGHVRQLVEPHGNIRQLFHRVRLKGEGVRHVLPYRGAYLKFHMGGVTQRGVTLFVAIPSSGRLVGGMDNVHHTHHTSAYDHSSHARSNDDRWFLSRGVRGRPLLGAGRAVGGWFVTPLPSGPPVRTSMQGAGTFRRASLLPVVGLFWVGCVVGWLLLRSCFGGPFTYSFFVLARSCLVTGRVYHLLSHV